MLEDFQFLITAAALNSAGRATFFEKVTSKQRREGDEWVSRVGIWRKNISGKGNIQSKAGDKTLLVGKAARRWCDWGGVQERVRSSRGGSDSAEVSGRVGHCKTGFYME